MLRRAVKLLLTNSTYSQYNIKSAPMSAVRKEKWDLYAGVLIERLPIVTKTLEPFEKEIQDMLNQIEFEQSLKCNSEIQDEKERALAELQKKGEIDVDLDAAAKQTVQDLKDMWKEELTNFKTNSRLTTDDQSNNLKSINRLLEHTLILLMEQKLGNESHLLLPQGLRLEGETMRQTAERVVREKCGKNINVLFYGNTPCGFYKYKYSLNQRKESVGAKIFFYRCVLKQEHNKGKSIVIDETKENPIKYEWLQRNDLIGKLKKSYGESVSQFIL